MKTQELLAHIENRYPGLNKQKIKTAVYFVQELDEKDGCSQIDFGIITAVDTSIQAISAGLSSSDNDSSIYEAIVMLYQIILKMKR